MAVLLVNGESVTTFPLMREMNDKFIRIHPAMLDSLKEVEICTSRIYWPFLNETIDMKCWEQLPLMVF